MSENLAAKIEAMDVEDDVLEEDDLVEDDFEGEIEEEEEEEDDEQDEEEHQEQERPPVVDESFERLTPHLDAVYAVALREGQTVTGGGDDVAFHRKGSATYTLRGHGDSVTCVGFSHDAALVATGSYDGSVRVWRDGECLQKLEGPGEVEWLDFHPRGDVLLAGSQDGTAWLWQARTGECLRVFVGHDGPVSCGFFTPDGNSIITGSADGTVRAWAPKKGTCKRQFDLKDPVVALAKNDDDIVVAALDGPAVAVISVNKAKKVVATLGLPSDRVATAVATSSAAASSASVSASWVAVGDDDGALRIFDYAKDTKRLEVTSFSGAVVALEWHPTEPRLTAVHNGDPPAIRNLDARTGALLYEFRGHTDLILAFDVRHDGTTDTILTAGDDKQPRLFQATRSSASGDDVFTKKLAT